MAFDVTARLSDSPYVESVMHGRTLSSGTTIRPSEIHWHMVLTRYHDMTRFLVVGPLTKSSALEFVADAEILWIKFKLGTFMPHLPLRGFLDVETPLPEAAGRNFWLKGSAWTLPNYENADTFVDRLMRDEVLVHDPLVRAVLQGRPPAMSPRTVRHRFLQATGLTQGHIVQFQRAQRAAALLQRGRTILDTVYEAGYFDQPHLTRSLKQFIGHTPAQLQSIAV